MKKEYGRQAYFFVGTHPCQGWTAKFKPFCNMFSPSIINLFMYLGYLSKKISSKSSLEFCIDDLTFQSGFQCHIPEHIMEL